MMPFGKQNNRMQQNNFDISVQRFDEFAGEFANRFMDVSAYGDSVDGFCARIESPKPRILELGCGPGNVTRLLKNHFPEAKITGIDLAPAMIEIARKNMSDTDFRVMDVRNISAIPELFDAILCAFCLPFLSNPDAEKLISDCAARLNSGGVLYVSTMEGNESDAGFESTSFSGDAEIYFNYYERHFLEAVFARNGFKIIQSKFQEYPEPDGKTTTDMIFIGVKM